MDALSERFATCVGCAGMFPAPELVRLRCNECHQLFVSKRDALMVKANERALSTAARQILQGIAKANKGDPQSPAFVEGMLERLGGARNFGEMCAEQFYKARGEDKFGNPIPGAPQSPMQAQKYADMISRCIARNDERSAVEVGNLKDEDLLSTLQALSLDLVESSEDYCQVALETILSKRPELLDRAMNAAGRPVIDAAKEPEKVTSIPGIDLNEIGIDDEVDASEL